MSRPAIRLRRLLPLLMGLTAALAVGTAVLLMFFSSVIHRTAAAMGASLESVRLSEEAEVTLLRHAQAESPGTRAQIERQLRQRLDALQAHIGAEGEQTVMEDAQEAVDAYLDAARASPRPSLELRQLLGHALASVSGVVQLNVEQAALEQAAADRWNHLADVLGLVASVTVIALLGGSMFWLSRALGPGLRLQDAMSRYAAGERDARAPEEGAEELREMARRFNQMATSLEEQRALARAFLAGVAHDMRNPLSVLRLSTARLPEDGPLPPEEKLRALLDTIQRQTRRLERLASDFVDTARIDAGQFDLQLEAQDLGGVARNVVDLFEGSSEKHQVTLALPDAPTWVRCDGARMEQVLNNLVSNAIKYSPEGGQVRVSLEVRGDEVTASVSDEGVGMAAVDIQELFSPFRRLAQTASEIPGVGLGLFVVRRIVEAHGGRVEVESTPGRGSTFTLHLPRVATEGLEWTPAVPPELSPGTTV